jgi:hypothetical protein
MYVIRWRWHGNLVYEFADGKCLYSSDWTTALDSNKNLIPRPCPRCKKLPTKEGHDACLGHIPGLKAACCGHGFPGEAYVVWKDGIVNRW